MNYVCSTIAKIREKFPWPTRPTHPFNEVPELQHLLENLQSHRVHDLHFTSRRYLLMHNRANWAGVDPQISLFTHSLMSRLRKKGFPTYVHTAYRSPSEQQALYNAGHSKLSKDGPHQRGAAVDIVHSEFHWNCHDDFWRYIGNEGKAVARVHNIPIEWGGDWDFFDPAHWQLKNWFVHEPYVYEGEPLHRSPYSTDMRFK